MIRKINKVLLIVFACCLFVLPINFIMPEASSKSNTLADLRKHLKELQAEKSSNESKQNSTKSEINSAKNNVSYKQNQIAVNQQKVQDAINESKKLDQEIKDGKGKLEELVKVYQIAQGDNVYLEYIFDSKSYEELVYRYAVMEQIMSYQEKQITEWKTKIERNTQLKSDLEKKEVELNGQIDSLSKDIKKLDKELDSLDEMYQDIGAEIKSVKEEIKMYEDLGCKENESLEVCLKVAGDKMLRKPLTKGKITSNFGYRTHPITHKVNSFHSGTDVAIAEGTKVYATANGTVSKIVKRSSCGGNMVYIQHLVNGKKWTSTYMHLLQIKVKVGQVVTNETVIGLSGGKTTKSYDNCTAGAHLHFSLATGWYEKDYFGYNKWKAHLVDAAKTVPLPKSWSSR